MFCWEISRQFFLAESIVFFVVSTNVITIVPSFEVTLSLSWETSLEINHLLMFFSSHVGNSMSYAIKQLLNVFDAVSHSRLKSQICKTAKVQHLSCDVPFLGKFVDQWNIVLTNILHCKVKFLPCLC